jgi:hypothetical protein
MFCIRHCLETSTQIVQFIALGSKSARLGGHWFSLYEPRHDKTNIMGLRPAWIQASLCIHAVWSGPMLFAISFCTCYRVVSEYQWSWSDCADAQADMDPCWLQTHYVCFIMTRLIIHIMYYYIVKTNSKISSNWQMLEVRYCAWNIV